MANSQVFLDANVLVYALDETSEQYATVVAFVQRLLDEDVTLCTSHHVIEEVLHIARKIGGTTTSEVVSEIGKIPNLVLIEPDAVLAFAKRYAVLSDKLGMGVNDTLLLQLMLDAGVTRLFSYDKQFVNRASSLGIESVAG
jgi:predicted nucleic acid-binding protein